MARLAKVSVNSASQTALAGRLVKETEFEQYEKACINDAALALAAPLRFWKVIGFLLDIKHP